MGLFDGALGNLVNSALGGSQNVAQNPMQGNNAILFVMTLVQDCGGLPKVIEMFNQSGLAKEISSWVGNGEKLPISAEQIQQVFTPEALQAVASKLGVPANEANGMIAKILPGLVSHLTPTGIVPENHSDLLSQGLSMLKGGNFLNAL